MVRHLLLLGYRLSAISIVASTVGMILVAAFRWTDNDVTVVGAAFLQSLVGLIACDSLLQFVQEREARTSD